MGEGAKETGRVDMDYRVARHMPISACTATGHAVAWSQCNCVAAISLQGIHVYELTANVSDREPYHLQHRLIASSTETNPNQDPAIPRALLNKDISFHQVYDVFMDRTVSPARASDEPYPTAFRQVSWSPLGLLANQKCILAGVTADHRVLFYGNGRWTWEELDQPSAQWCKYVRTQDWLGVDRDDEDIFTTFKNRSYLLGTIAIDWSPLYGSVGTSKWAWFFCLQRSGHLVVWRARAPFQRVQLEAFHDLELVVPSTMKIYPFSSGWPFHQDQLLVLTGSHQGLVKCHRWSWNATAVDDASSPTAFHPMGDVITEEDGMIVSAMAMYRVHERYGVVVVVKNNIVLFFCARIDQGDPMQWKFLDQRHVIIRSLNITGLQLLDNGRIVCCTEDYKLFEMEADVDAKSGSFRGPDAVSVRPVRMTTNPVMLCRGIAVSRQPTGLTLFTLESLKVPHDHLQCRQPSNITVYVAENYRAVLKGLEGLTSMSSALVALESYKALCGSSWESIWEPDVDDWNMESITHLQLVRWFSAFKAQACNDSASAKDDLKIRARIAELWLRKRHVEAILKQLLDGSESISEDQRLTVHLYCQFLTVHLTAASAQLETAVAGNQPMVDRIRDEYLRQRPLPEEPCGICGSVIVFDDVASGQCSAGHQAPRCVATLRLCFGRTLTCRWCGAFYRKEPVFQELMRCVLCGGPTKNSV